MLVTKKKYRSLEMMKEKEKADYLGIIGEMRQEAKKDRVSLEQELIGLNALSCLNRSLDEKNYCILGIEINDLGQLLAVTSTRNDKPSDIILYSLRDNKYQEDNSQPRVVVSSNFITKELKIEEIYSMEIEDKSGNGTILLKYLTKEAKRWEFSSIISEFDKVKADDLKKLKYFYEKNDYIITFNEEKNIHGVALEL